MTTDKAEAAFNLAYPNYSSLETSEARDFHFIWCESWQAATAAAEEMYLPVINLMVRTLRGILPGGGMHYDHVRDALAKPLLGG